MTQLRLDNVSFAYLSKPVLQNASCLIQAGCFGVIGPNGSGKTTFLKLILGQLKPDSGFIVHEKDLEIAYLPQEITINPEAIAFDVVWGGAHQVHALKRTLDQIEKRFADPAVYNSEKKLARLIAEQEQVITDYNRLGGPGLEGQINALLSKIGFESHESQLPVKHLSGGQKKLLGLAQVMIGRPDILLLDEPDNHLDLQGKAMLEKLIKDFQGSVVIVSHDRYFLDMVVDQILEVEHGQINQFAGNYSEFMFEKHLKLARQAEMFQTQQKEITRLEQAAKRLLMWGKVYDNAKFSIRGKNILKRIERMDKIEQPKTQKEKIEINLGGWRGSQKVLEINNLFKGFDKPDGSGFASILTNIDILLRSGDRVGMIGPNGAGKSLLIQMILGYLSPDSGAIVIGPSIQTGYYSQEFSTLNPKQTLLETICKAGNLPENKGVAFLKKYLFAYEQRDSLVGSLSGGERARLQIALITLSGANFLLLDEPTNHLDIPACEILEDALLSFDGTILTVSHDRYFLDRIVNRVIVLHRNGTEEYLGNYSDYEKHHLLNTKPSG